MANIPAKNLGSVHLIEDDPELVEIVTQALTQAGYTLTTSSSSEQAFTAIFKSPPDVVILDINLPDLDGFHIARELKRNLMFRDVPLIVLSNRIDFLDKMRSLDIIMDEYLVKPIDVNDLLLRTQLVKERAQAHLDANPLTRLPGNTAIVKSLQMRIGSGKPYAVGYVDLNNFKAFNDKYGFSNGDEVLRYTAKTIVNVVEKLSPNLNFIGHVGGDDFVFICAYENASEICQKMTDEFDKGAKNFYSEEDRKNGYVVVEDRRGVVSQIPLVSMSIGLASDEGGKFSNLGQINHSLTQLKKYAKSFHGSAYVRDRRTANAPLAEFTWGPGSAAGSPKVLEQITSAISGFLPGQLTEIIKTGTISVLFQPILDMKTDDVVGVEALVRGPANTPLEYPDALFQTARTSNQVLSLDRLCMKKILEASSQLNRGLKIFINIFPETFLDREKSNQDIFDSLSSLPQEIILELTGAHRSNDPLELFAELAPYKDRGFKVCIDAATAALDQGYRFLTELKPHYIKLNMVTFKGMLNDHQKQNSFSNLIGAIRQTGAEVICTKLESRSDSYLALKSGIRLGQGFLFARPSQIPANPEKIKR
ncbi:MAG: Sensor histidine kinase RcsC [Elusimicrobia bacterium]|nr:Sensor histidine kinase RcsC [Elusimicrobiota bacterium]